MKVLFIIALLFAAFHLWFRDPSAESIISKTVIDIDGGTIRSGDITYQAEWGETIEYEGDLRYVGRAYDPLIPIVTTDAILTTGEYSDPSKVRVTPIRNGNMMYFKQGNPQGSLVVLHFVPIDKQTLLQLEELREGESVRLSGREEIDSEINGSDTSFFKLQHSNHRILLVESVERNN